MSDTAIVTIVANNYLAYACVLAESFKEHHPDVEVFVCVVDRPHPQVRYSNMPFRTIFVDELDIPGFDSFAFRYDLLELSTAIKPFLLSHLKLEHDLDRVYYFDPDILICDRLSGLDEALKRNSVILTPHLAQPLTDDYHPTERQIRLAGIYNLGFLGIRFTAESLEFLRWWQDRLYRFCLVDPPNGLFVDQSWMDFAPAFLDRVGIIRDPIYNIAYWNLGQRHPVLRGERWQVDGRNMGFFHFSGVNCDDLAAVSRHQDRFSLADRPELRPLFEHYRDLVRNAGHDKLRLLPGAYNFFRHTEIPIPKVARTLLAETDPIGKRWRDPFDIRTKDSFFQWLIDPIEHTSGRLNRIALGIWESRADLKVTFPEVRGKNLRDFANWLLLHGGAEQAGLHPLFVESLGRIKPAPAAAENKLSSERYPYSAAVSSSGAMVFDSLNLANPKKERLDWLNQIVPGARRSRPVVTYTALLVHRARPDLQAEFPDPLGKDQVRYAHWFVRNGAREHRLHPSLVSPVLHSFPARTHLKVRARELVAWARHLVRKREVAEESAFAEVDLEAAIRGRGASPAKRAEQEAFAPLEGGAPGGVNLAGYFDATTGIGQMGRASAAAIERAGFGVARLALDRPPTAELNAEGCPFPITLFNANADETPRAVARLPAVIRARNYKIGYWYWELAHFPLAFADRFRMLDEVWAPTHFCRAAYQAISTIPVRHVPPFVPPPSRDKVERARFGLDSDRFYFLFAFDVLSVPERKNPLAAISAFRQLHKLTKDRVGLVLKVSRAPRAPDLMSSLRAEAEGLPIVFLTEDLSRLEMNRLIGSADAILSLHRSEGFGLLPVEGLYLDKPVVATEYGGVTDFLDRTTGFPVPFELIQLDRSQGPYPAGSVWADPDPAEAAELMLRVVEDPEEAQRRTAQGKHRIERVYGLDAAAERFGAELRRIHQKLGLHAEPELDVPRLLALTAVDSAPRR